MIQWTMAAFPLGDLDTEWRFDSVLLWCAMLAFFTLSLKPGLKSRQILTWPIRPRD